MVLRGSGTWGLARGLRLGREGQAGRPREPIGLVLEASDRVGVFLPDLIDASLEPWIVAVPALASALRRSPRMSSIVRPIVVTPSWRTPNDRPYTEVAVDAHGAPWIRVWTRRLARPEGFEPPTY